MMMRIYCGIFILLLFLPILQLSFNIFQNTSLMGVEAPPPKPEWSIYSWLDGTFQVHYSKRRSSKLGLRGYFVKTYNQLHYSLFHRVVSTSGTRIVIAKDDWLFEKPYIRKVDARSRDNGIRVKNEAKLLGRLQRELEKIGVTFVFVLAPSKAEVYREFIPENLLTNILPAGAKTDYQYFKEALEKQGVNLIDSHFLFMKEKQARNYHLFGPSGTHWNKYGAYLIWRGIASVVRGKINIPLQLPALERIEKRPSELVDADLGALLNLWDKSLSTPLTDYPVFAMQNKKLQDKPSILVIGDSFLFTLIDIIKRADLTSDLDAWYYFKRHYHYPAKGGQLMDFEHAVDKPMTPDDVDWQNQFFEKDLVIMVQTQLWLPNVGFGFIQSALDEIDRIRVEQKF